MHRSILNVFVLLSLLCFFSSVLAFFFFYFNFFFCGESKNGFMILNDQNVRSLESCRTVLYTEDRWPVAVLNSGLPFNLFSSISRYGDSFGHRLHLRICHANLPEKGLLGIQHHYVVHIENMWIKQLCNRKVGFCYGFTGRKVSRAFEKRYPVLETGSLDPEPSAHTMRTPRLSQLLVWETEYNSKQRNNHDLSNQ